ncbi:Hypothetical protein A7982_05641 [Minicystis rosea]|nr:Hypothetical protein A7982_05641 [Minicystis rosea]
MIVRAEPPEGWGTWGEELARRLVQELGERVLQRFPRLERTDAAAVLDAAAARLVRSGPPSAGSIEAHVRRTVYCEALPVDRRRFIDDLGVKPACVQQALDRARARIATLTERELRVLYAVSTLDAVAEDDEAGKVVLHAAVAHQMRWNTAHQNVSRAWRKLCDESLSAWGTEWRAAHRFICDPPSFELWLAARQYLDACSGRGAHGGPAFAAWTRAHEEHNSWFNEWKKQSSLATQRWRALAEQLDHCGLRPRDLIDPLVDGCRLLGIDRWVIPAKLRQQSWRDLLKGAPRPAPDARAAWRTLLRGHPFGAGVESALRELEREASLAEVAGVELEAAYHRLLASAESRSDDGVRAKNEFRRLIEAARWV